MQGKCTTQVHLLYSLASKLMLLTASAPRQQEQKETTLPRQQYLLRRRRLPKQSYYKITRERRVHRHTAIQCYISTVPLCVVLALRTRDLDIELEYRYLSAELTGPIMKVEEHIC